jgi:glycerol-3-phosphate dehydrogenase (NAD(P)+)
MSDAAPRIAVVGAGAWGTALALHAGRTGARVSLWARDVARAAASPRLPGAVLPAGTLVAGLPGEADAVLLCVPMQRLREIAARLPPGGPLVLCCKGLESGTGLLPLEVVAALHPGRPAAVLSGPNFAREVAAGLPAASVLAAADPALRARLVALLATPAFRLYGNDDVAGVQVGGAAKNVVAIAAGAVVGAGLGENARAALVTRGLVEIGRLAQALGGRADTVAGLSGLGDLLLTCTGPSSRNYRFGLALGEGATPAEALDAQGAVVEGMATAGALVRRAAGVELPICAAVAALVAGEMTLAEAIAALLARARRDE